MKVGDLVELSATGRKIHWCAKATNKQGIVINMLDRGMYPIVVFWFGLGHISHRRLTLKLMKKSQKK